MCILSFIHCYDRIHSHSQHIGTDKLIQLSSSPLRVSASLRPYCPSLCLKSIVSPPAASPMVPPLASCPLPLPHTASPLPWTVDSRKTSGLRAPSFPCFVAPKPKHEFRKARKLPKCKEGLRNPPDNEPNLSSSNLIKPHQIGETSGKQPACPLCVHLQEIMQISS